MQSDRRRWGARQRHCLGKPVCPIGRPQPPGSPALDRTSGSNQRDRPCRCNGHERHDGVAGVAPLASVGNGGRSPRRPDHSLRASRRADCPAVEACQPDSRVPSPSRSLNRLSPIAPADCHPWLALRSLRTGDYRAPRTRRCRPNVVGEHDVPSFVVATSPCLAVRPPLPLRVSQLDDRAAIFG